MTSGGAMTVDAWRGGGADTRAWMAVGAVLLVIGLAAFIASPVLGAAVIGLFVVPLFVIAPRHALLVFVALLPFDAVSALGDTDGALSLTRLVGLALFGGWVLHLLVERRSVRITRAGWHLIAFVAFAAASVAWAADPSVTLSALATLVQLLLLALMAADVLRKPEDVRRMIDVLLVSTTVVAILVLSEVQADTRRATLTLFGESVNANFLAAILVFPAVAAFGVSSARGRFGWWRLAAVLPIALALFLSGSRGGAVAFLGGLFLIGTLRRRASLAAVAVAIGLAVLLPAVVPQATVDRLLDRFSAAEQDRLSGRTDIWRVAMAMAEDHPIQGLSFGAFSDNFYHYMLTAGVDPEFGRMHSRGNRAAHNIYLGALAELGLVGVGLLLAALWAHARALWRARLAALRRHDEATAMLALTLFGVFGSIVLFGATIDLLATKATWMWLAMMQAVACMHVARPQPRRA